jgi:hypothetical protein
LKFDSLDKKNWPIYHPRVNLKISLNIFDQILLFFLDRQNK